MNSDALKNRGLAILGLTLAFAAGTQLEKITSPASGTTAEEDRRALRIADRADSQSTSGDNSSASSNLGDRKGGSASSLGNLFSSSTLSGSGLEALAREALSDPNPVKRRLAFARLLEGLTPENSLEMRNQLEALGADRQNWQEFHYAWGAIAGKAAFTDALASGKHDLEALVSGWAAVDPAGAIGILADLPEELQEHHGLD